MPARAASDSQARMTIAADPATPEKSATGGRIPAIRGTRDLLGAEAAAMAGVVAAFERVGALFGFQPVMVPIFEYTQLFARGIGETTDVVAKEMYSFADRNDESLTLRPELTAGIARAFLSNGWQQFAPLRVMGHGPAFRYERPQKGRYRQFHQIDAEVIGAAEPQADIELIGFAAQLLDTLGCGHHVTLELNTLGDGPSRLAYRDALVAHFSMHRAALSQDSVRRLEKNPLRILDSKDEGDRVIVAQAPPIDAFLTSDAEAFFAEVTAGLDAIGVAYTRNPRLVRGLDYYCHTAFEFTTTALGAQGTVIGGGRYDGLIEQLGGPATPAVGWAGGIERLALLLGAPDAPPPDVAIVPLGGAPAQTAALALAAACRRAGLRVEQGLRGNLKKRLARANSSGTRAAILIGENELASGSVTLKDLAAGTQTDVPIDAVPAQVAVMLRQA